MFDDLRSAWGAVPPTKTPTRVSPANRTEFMNHYDGGVAIVVNSHAECLARVKHDQTYHMKTNGWSDIGYNGLVCQHGRAIEGRGIDFIGAHCTNHNTAAYGWQFMVGGSQVPTPQAYARMAKAYADCASRSGHTLKKMGHSDGFATLCPGKAVYGWVQAGMPSPLAPPEDDVNLTEDDARLFWTGFAGLKNTLATNPDTAPRVTGSNLLESTAALAKSSKADLTALTKAVGDLKAQIAALPATEPISDAQLERVLRKIITSIPPTS